MARRIQQLNKREVVTSYFNTLVNYIKDESMTLVNQHSKQFKEEPTIENKDWRGAQLILETFLLDCGLQLIENARRGISAGLTFIPSTNCFKLACDQIGVEDITVVKPSKRK